MYNIPPILHSLFCSVLLLVGVPRPRKSFTTLGSRSLASQRHKLAIKGNFKHSRLIIHHNLDTISSATVDSGLQGREGSRSCYNGDSVSSKTLGTSWSHGRKLSFSILHRHLDWQCCHKSSIYDELDRHSWRSSCSRTTVISHIRSQ